MTRTEMIEYLTNMELDFLVMNPTKINEVAIFFASGGYFNLTDEELQKYYDLMGPECDDSTKLEDVKIEEEENEEEESLSHWRAA